MPWLLLLLLYTAPAALSHVALGMTQRDIKQSYLDAVIRLKSKGITGNRKKRSFRRVENIKEW